MPLRYIIALMPKRHYMISAFRAIISAIISARECARACRARFRFTASLHFMKLREPAHGALMPGSRNTQSSIFYTAAAGPKVPPSALILLGRAGRHHTAPYKNRDAHFECWLSDYISLKPRFIEAVSAIISQMRICHDARASRALFARDAEAYYVQRPPRLPACRRKHEEFKGAKPRRHFKRRKSATCCRAADAGAHMNDAYFATKPDCMAARRATPAFSATRLLARHNITLKYCRITNARLYFRIRHECYARITSD